MTLAEDLSALAALPGGGAACAAVARSLLERAPREGAKALQRRGAARAALDIAEDRDAPQEARREAAVCACLALSCAVFWSAPSSSCHAIAEAYDRAMVSAIRKKVSRHA